MFQTQVPDGTAQPISAPLTYFLMGVLHAGCLVGMAPEAHELKKHAKEHLVNKIGHIHIKEKFTSFSVNYIGFEPGNTKAPRHIWIYCCRYLLIIMVSTVTWGTLFFFDLWKYSDIFSIFTKLHFWIFSYIFIWYICIISIIPVCSVALVLLCIVWTLYCFCLHILGCLSSICGLTNKINTGHCFQLPWSNVYVVYLCSQKTGLVITSLSQISMTEGCHSRQEQLESSFFFLRDKFH